MKKFVILICFLAFPTLALSKTPPVTVDDSGRLVIQKYQPTEPAKNQNSEYDAGAQMGLPEYAGTGCPNGSISATLSPDNRTLSVIFDNFSTEAMPASVDRKNCRLKIPVKVSPGFQVAIVKSDVRGFTSLPENSKTVVRTTHHISIVQGAAEKQVDKKPFTRVTTFTGPMDDEIYIGQHIESEQIWSPCGASFRLNIGTMVTVSNEKSNDLAMAVVDSIDLQTEDKAMKYHLNWRRCVALTNALGQKVSSNTN